MEVFFKPFHVFSTLSPSGSDKNSGGIKLIPKDAPTNASPNCRQAILNWGELIRKGQMADGQSQIRAQQQKEGVSEGKKESINQPSDIYALILPVRGGMAFTGLGKLGPAKKVPTTVKLSSMKQRPTLRYIESYRKCNFVAGHVLDLTI